MTFTSSANFELSDSSAVKIPSVEEGRLGDGLGADDLSPLPRPTVEDLIEPDSDPPLQGKRGKKGERDVHKKGRGYHNV